jgi:hypothetical protein
VVQNINPSAFYHILLTQPHNLLAQGMAELYMIDFLNFEVLDFVHAVIWVFCAQGADALKGLSVYTEVDRR